MDLFQILLNISLYQDDEIIYVAQPWTLESEAKVLNASNQNLIQMNEHHLNFQYFLDISTAKEMLEDSQPQNVCYRDQCQRVIEYVLDEI
ncbi:MULTISPECIES: hypothetical protein [unclassified Acinetobacter]|uniref:hypothetical protein n=1 Tax=unclassified Acinetobacter TaxID=196816 RepID=UPI001909FF03|nr:MULTISPECIES: hypothetical protein [unclassified Acinetobacter]MBK0064899.1 hypothetical protein [Acinetobacter sp. S55]MBK0068278.1 hypothetical protein [Acinetobacter sp. S54]